LELAEEVEVLLQQEEVYLFVVQLEEQEEQDQI
jgi:hypothetical protein